jgi:hypothetical protein
MGHAEIRINMARILDRNATHLQRDKEWATQSSGSTRLGYHVGRPLINGETRMGHAEIRINIARISGRKATRQQRDKDGQHRTQDQHGQNIR